LIVGILMASLRWATGAEAWLFFVVFYDCFERDLRNNDTYHITVLLNYIIFPKKKKRQKKKKKKKKK